MLASHGLIREMNTFHFEAMKWSARPVNNTSSAHIEFCLCLQSFNSPRSSIHSCNNHQISQSSSQPSNNLASQSSVITPSEHSDSQPTSHSPGIQQLKQSANQANYLASTYDFVLSCLILSYLILSCFVLAMQWSSRQAGNSSLGSSGWLAGWLTEQLMCWLTDWLTARLHINIYIYKLINKYI